MSPSVGAARRLTLGESRRSFLAKPIASIHLFVRLSAGETHRSRQDQIKTVGLGFALPDRYLGYVGYKF